MDGNLKPNAEEEKASEMDVSMKALTATFALALTACSPEDLGLEAPGSAICDSESIVDTVHSIVRDYYNKSGPVSPLSLSEAYRDRMPPASEFNSSVETIRQTEIELQELRRQCMDLEWMKDLHAWMTAEEFYYVGVELGNWKDRDWDSVQSDICKVDGVPYPKFDELIAEIKPRIESDQWHPMLEILAFRLKQIDPARDRFDRQEQAHLQVSAKRQEQLRRAWDELITDMDINVYNIRDRGLDEMDTRQCAADLSAAGKKAAISYSIEMTTEGQPYIEASWQFDE